MNSDSVTVIPMSVSSVDHVGPIHFLSLNATGLAMYASAIAYAIDSSNGIPMKIPAINEISSRMSMVIFSDFIFSTLMLSDERLIFNSFLNCCK